MGGLAVMFALLGAALGLHHSAAPAPGPARSPAEALAAQAAATAASEMPCSLQGTVRDLEGQPIAEGTLCAAPVDDAARVQPNHCVLADAHGAYFFARLEPAAYVITAAADGYDPGVAHGGRALKLTGYGSMIGVDIVLQPADRISEMIDASQGPAGRAPVQVPRPGSQLVAPASARGSDERRPSDRARARTIEAHP